MSTLQDIICSTAQNHAWYQLNMIQNPDYFFHDKVSQKAFTT